MNYRGPFFDKNDIHLLIALAGGLNPDKYVTDDAKALIYKAKMVLNSDTGAYQLDLR